MLPIHLYQGAKKALLDEAGRLRDKLARGHWHGEHEGKKLCGEIAGLERAVEIVRAELEKLEKLEGDDVDE